MCLTQCSVVSARCISLILMRALQLEDLTLLSCYPQELNKHVLAYTLAYTIKRSAKAAPPQVSGFS